MELEPVAGFRSVRWSVVIDRKLFSVSSIGDKANETNLPRPPPSLGLPLCLPLVDPPVRAFSSTVKEKEVVSKIDPSSWEARCWTESARRPVWSMSSSVLLREWGTKSTLNVWLRSSRVLVSSMATESRCKKEAEVMSG